MEELSISIIIPARNEEHFLCQTLHQLSKQDYPSKNTEIIIADGMSTDSTVAKVKDYIDNHKQQRIVLLENTKRLSSAGRNLGIRFSRGDYVLIIDAHVHIPNPTLISNMINCIKKHKAIVLGRPQPLLAPNINTFQTAVAISRSSPLAHSRESLIYSDVEGWVNPFSVAIMYQRRLFDIVGYFDESFDAAEDLEFNYRLEKLGIPCYFSPEFKIYYYPRKNLRDFYKQMKRYGIGRGKFLLKHKDRFRVENVIPSFCLIFALLSFVIGPLCHPLLVLCLLLAAIYAFILFVEGIRINLQHKKKHWILVPLSVAINHFALGIGVIQGVLHTLLPRLTKVR